MLNQLQIKRYCHRLQVEFRTLSKICKKLYYKYAPSRLTHRRNASLVKVPDYEIIALLVWQAEEGYIFSAQICPLLGTLWSF